MELFIGWLILSILVSVWASKKGRSGFGFFLLSCILSPLLSGLIVLLCSDNNRHACPECGEQIMKTARICPHCKTAHAYTAPATPVSGFLATAKQNLSEKW